MKLISPRGVRISVRDSKGEQLLKEGYRLAEDNSSATPPEATPKRKSKKDK